MLGECFTNFRTNWILIKNWEIELSTCWSSCAASETSASYLWANRAISEELKLQYRIKAKRYCGQGSWLRSWFRFSKWTIINTWQRSWWKGSRSGCPRESVRICPETSSRGQEQHVTEWGSNLGHHQILHTLHIHPMNTWCHTSHARSCKYCPYISPTHSSVQNHVAVIVNWMATAGGVSPGGFKWTQALAVEWIPWNRNLIRKYRASLSSDTWNCKGAEWTNNSWPYKAASVVS